jgi:hypothetical protein
MKRSSVAVGAGIVLVVIATAIVALNSARSAAFPPVLAQARADAPRVFQALHRMPQSEALGPLVTHEIVQRRLGRLIVYEQRYKAAGRYDDAIIWAKGELLNTGWTLDGQSTVRTTFRRNDSAPKTIWEAGTLRPIWIFEIEKDAVYDGAAPSYTFVVRLRCSV